MRVFNRNSSVRRKFALIIGNDNYTQPSNKLNHCVNNASDLADVLETINFNVTKFSNLTRQHMYDHISEFSKQIYDGDLVLLNFSGHGYQVNNKNVLIPVDDGGIETERDFEDFAVKLDWIILRLVENKSSLINILILDCCRPYVLRNTPMLHGNGLHEMTAPDGTLIQFSCAANETTPDDLFAKHLLRNISEENMDIITVFRRIVNDVRRERNQQQIPFSEHDLYRHRQVYLNRTVVCIPYIAPNAKWKSNAKTVTGNNRFGRTLNRLHYSRVYPNQYLYVSDVERHEVRRYRPEQRLETVVAGGNGQGRALNQLNHPTYIFVDRDQSVYVSDSWNNRVVRWEKNAEVGAVVAGGNGKGSDQTQLDHPTGVLVDQLGTVYVADYWNNRVMRWCKDASHVDVIIGGGPPGKNANQLNGPEGLEFDRHGNLYVVDSKNHRIQRFDIQTA